MMSLHPHHIIRRKFPFKREFFTAAGVHNIPGIVIAAGHGYDHRAYMCISCGNVVVVDHEMLFRERTDINGIVKDMHCPSCERELTNGLVEHPEHVFHNGGSIQIDGVVDRSEFSATEVIEVYAV